MCSVASLWSTFLKQGTKTSEITTKSNSSPAQACFVAHIILKTVHGTLIWEPFYGTGMAHIILGTFQLHVIQIEHHQLSKVTPLYSCHNENNSSITASSWKLQKWHVLLWTLLSALAAVLIFQLCYPNHGYSNRVTSYHKTAKFKCRTKICLLLNLHWKIILNQIQFKVYLR